MPHYAIDTETYEKKEDGYHPLLHAHPQHYLVGVTIGDGEEPKTYTTAADHLNALIDLIRKNATYKHRTHLYAHNMSYDFHTLLPRPFPKEFVIISFKPFIAKYYHEGHDWGLFLDSMSLAPMALKKLGGILGKEKKDMPGIIKTVKDFSTLTEYCIRDTEIVYEFITRYKERLASHGIILRNLISTSQVAGRFLTNTLRKQPDAAHLFYNQERGQYVWPRANDIIHEAYRGGRVTAFQTGTFTNVTEVDRTMAYTATARDLHIPELTTESLINEPLRIYDTDILLQQPGVSLAILDNVSDTIGFLPVRYQGSNYYPLKGTRICGCYTNDELRHAQEIGWEVKTVIHSLIWDKNTSTPLKTYADMIAHERRNSTNEFDTMFWKSMGNMAWGKLGQHRKHKSYQWDTIDKTDAYANQGSYAKMTLDYQRLFETEDEEFEWKDYYCPLIPALITAQCRIAMDRIFRKIPPEDLLYTDTDNLLLLNYTKNKKHIPLGNDIGQFHEAPTESECVIYGNKTYMLGGKIVIAGFHKSDITREGFLSGRGTTTTMTTFRSAKTPDDAGKFTERTREFTQEAREYLERKHILERRKLYIDEASGHYPDLIEQLEVP